MKDELFNHKTMKYLVMDITQKGWKRIYFNLDEKFLVVGESYGGYVALGIACRVP